MSAHRPQSPFDDLEAETARVRERFEHLLAAGIAISSRHALGEVLQQVVDSARDVVGARYAALGVLGGDGRTLVEFVTSGLSRAEQEKIGPLPQGRGLLGLVIRDGRPIRVPRIGQHPHSWGFPPGHPRMESFLGVPIAGRTGVFGNLYLTDKLGAPQFTEEDEAIAVLLAAQAAAAVESARLYEATTTLLAQVQAMQRQREQFFAMINHELRNALTGVYGWAERLQRARTPEAMQRSGKEVFESAERTVALLNNLLDLSRLDAGRIVTVFRETDIASVIERAQAVARPAAEAKGLVLLADVPAPPPIVRTDGLRLEQIIVNLLSNAIRHSHPGEDVVTRAEVAGDTVLIHVIDRGPGIALDVQERIFEPYVRAHPESGLGSGLGLPVSRRLAELLGGRLTVHSDLGSGATFTVTIPHVPPDPERTP